MVTPFIRVVSFGFRSLVIDAWIAVRNTHKIDTGLYIDDLLITRGHMYKIEKVVKVLMSKFNMKDVKNIRNLLGMLVLRDEHLMCLN